MWADDNVIYVNMLFCLLYYDIISLTSLNITQAFHLLLDFAENQGIILDFKIQNSIRIAKGSDNRDSDTQGLLYYSSKCQFFAHVNSQQVLKEAVWYVSHY